ncbi:hypothetical protein ACIBCH_09700 [Amycolatopsis thailandensis]|uniref:hypothetical protein n=1 Tax=Amycolatopsis thailandensis TaxID=589330 RepID=UPI00378C08E4
MSEVQCRDIVKERSGGDCEVRIEGWCQGRAREFQHRLPAGRGGLFVPSNGLAVCGHGNFDGCHGFIHQNPTIAEKFGWTVETGVDPALKAVEVWIWGRMKRSVLLDDDGDFDFDIPEEGAA